MKIADVKAGLQAGDIKALARAISLIENESDNYEDLLQSLQPSSIPVLGITGPPGAGKSTLTDGLVASYVAEGKKVAVLCVDPSSPFHFGALLGDRIRMNRWYNNDAVYIRSLASRGSLGGLSQKIIEITDVVRSSHFDMVLIETVGIGQSEVEVAGLADVTIVTLVPEAGDDVQAIKAGMMEVADIFAINKADRPGADAFVMNIKNMIAGRSGAQANTEVVKTVATTGEGIADLRKAVDRILQLNTTNEKQQSLLAAKAWQLLQHSVMKKYDRRKFTELLLKKKQAKHFNVYRFVRDY